MAFILFRGDYDKRRDQVSPGTPAALPPMPADLPRNRLGPCPMAAAAGTSADRPRDGQPLLAGSVRHRAGAHDRRFGRQRRIALASRIARLDGGRVPRVGLGHEEVLSSCWSLRPPIGRRRRSRPRNWKRTWPEPAALARAAVPHGRRNGSRLCPGRRAGCWCTSSAARASGPISRREFGKR